MLYGFTPLPDCNDPETLQNQFLSHNETFEDCMITRRKYISGRVYLAVSVLNAFFIIMTTLLLLYCAASPSKDSRSSSVELNSKNRLRLAFKKYSLQKKSITCATMGAFGHLIFSSCVLLAQALNSMIACYLILYGSVVGFYTWVFAFCTRAYRLRYLFRLNQFKVKYSRMSEEEKLTCLKDKNYRWYVTHSQKDLTKVLRIPFLVYALSLVIILIITIPSNLHAVQTSHSCNTTWGASVLLGMFGFFIAFLSPLIIYCLKDNPDAHGIRTELWIITFFGFPLFLLYAVFFFKISPVQADPTKYMSRVFAPANWVVFFTAIGHVISVVVPLLQYMPIRIPCIRHIVFIKRRRAYANSSTENFDISRLAPRPTSSMSIPLELTMESLERALADPDLMHQLQDLAIRDFSSENLLFYERYLNLVDRLKTEWSIPSVSYRFDKSSLVENDYGGILHRHIPDKLLPDFIDFYEQFIRVNAPFQVNISYKARNTLDEAFDKLYRKNPSLIACRRNTIRVNDRVYDTHMFPLGNMHTSPTGRHNSSTSHKKDTSTAITLALFETARVEVCWNVFNSVYPKLIEIDN